MSEIKTLAFIINEANYSLAVATLPPRFALIPANKVSDRLPPARGSDWSVAMQATPVVLGLQPLGGDAVCGLVAVALQGFEDMPRRVPDLSKIRSLIGYRPTRTLNEIVDDVINFYRHGNGEHLDSHGSGALGAGR